MNRLITWESRPSVISIAKKRRDQRGATGIRVTAAGYTTKASPEPDDTTSATPTPSSLARKPRMLKMTKPANTDVEQLATAMMMASLRVVKRVVAIYVAAENLL